MTSKQYLRRVQARQTVAPSERGGGGITSLAKGPQKVVIRPCLQPITLDNQVDTIAGN